MATSTKGQIILIGNYLPDKQESMERFAKMLQAGISDAGYRCVIWRPGIVFNAPFKQSSQPLKKWLGYVDKWIVFPVSIKWRLFSKRLRKERAYFHVCDHSNAPYLKYLPPSRRSITCHDVLAIRGALGHADAYCTASRFGKILQRWIGEHLTNEKNIICVSEMTLQQLLEIKGGNKNEHNCWRIIHMGFNADFKPIHKQEAAIFLQDTEHDLTGPFLLHVGSGLPRKNRKLLVDMLDILGDKWKGKICFAGEGIDVELLDYAKQLNVADRMISVVKPDHDILLALYCSCEAFIFPSYSEGFGWPLIEAQACGVPVIASDIPPMPEISGGSALHYNPHNPELFADAFMWLQDKKNRSEIIRKGLNNIIRFDSQKMVKAYLDAFGLKPLNE